MTGSILAQAAVKLSIAKLAVPITIRRSIRHLLGLGFKISLMRDLEVVTLLFLALNHAKRKSDCLKDTPDRAQPAH